MPACHEIAPVENRRTLQEVFEEKHGKLPKTSRLTINCSPHMPGSTTSSSSVNFEVKPNMVFGDLTTFNIKMVEYQCSETSENAKTLDEMVAAAAEAATKTTVNAFQIMMAGGRKNVPLKTSRFV